MRNVYNRFGPAVLLTVICIGIIGVPFQRAIHTLETLQTSLSYAVATGNVPQQWRLRHLIATLSGRYDFSDANLNSQVVNIQPKRFGEWLYAAWSS